MARIPTKSLSILNDLAARGVREFSTRDVAERAGLTSKSASAQLSRLAEAGLVDRVARGRFVLRDLGLFGTSAASEDLSLALEAALDGRPGRISFRSALSELGLLSHPARSIHLASPRRLRIRTISGRPVTFHREAPTSLPIGAERLRENVWRSTQARAVLESAQRPDYAGGLNAVAEALMAATIDPEELGDLATRINQPQGLRRIGSLSDHLAGPLADRLHPPPRDRYIDLDPQLPATATAYGAWKDTRWGVAWPMPIIELRSAID